MSFDLYRQRALRVGMAATVVALASQANATIVSFNSFGGSYPLYNVPPGETLYTDFSAGNPGTATPGFTGGSVYTVPAGQQSISLGSGNYVAPPWTASGGTTQPFFAVLPGQSETFAFGSAVSDVGVYIGSLDDENLLTLELSGGGTVSFTGDQLAGFSGQSTPIPSGSYTITGARTNGRWTFSDGGLLNIVGITVSEGTAVASNSLEIAQITISAPEASTWTMMGLGFAGLAFAGYRARRAAVATAL